MIHPFIRIWEASPVNKRPESDALHNSADSYLKLMGQFVSSIAALLCNSKLVVL